MLKKGKTGNHNGQQNRKTEFFHCKNRKTDLKHGQNRKTENPNALSRREGFFNLLSQKKWRVGLRYELITKPERFLSFSIYLCFVIITMFLCMALNINSVNLSSVLGVKQPLMQRYLI